MSKDITDIRVVPKGSCGSDKGDKEIKTEKPGDERIWGQGVVLGCQSTHHTEEKTFC